MIKTLPLIKIKQKYWGFKFLLEKLKNLTFRAIDSEFQPPLNIWYKLKFSFYVLRMDFFITG